MRHGDVIKQPAAGGQVALNREGVSATARNFLVAKMPSRHTRMAPGAFELARDFIKPGRRGLESGGHATSQIERKTRPIP